MPLGPLREPLRFGLPTGSLKELAKERGAFVLDRSCEQSARERRKVEMCFAHLKRHLGFRRLRLRGMTGASDKFLLVAVMQNLKKRVRFSRGTRA
jgi:hypothetical protein